MSNSTKKKYVTVERLRRFRQNGDERWADGDDMTDALARIANNTSTLSSGTSLTQIITGDPMAVMPESEIDAMF